MSWEDDALELKSKKGLLGAVTGEYPAEAAGWESGALELKQKTQEPPWYRITNPTARNITKATLGALPGIGTAVGGLLATPADVFGGPLPTIAGAAGGAAIGKALQTPLEGLLLGEEKTRGEIYGGPIKEAAGGAAAEIGSQAAGKAMGLISKSKAGQFVGSKIGKGLAKVGEAFTGVPENEIKTYAAHADEIKAMAKSSDNSTAEAADQLRSKFADSIDATRKQMNEQISSSLSGSTKLVESKPIIESLNSAKANINPKLYPEQTSQIDDLIEKVSSLANKDGKLTVKSAHEIKTFLQDEASAAYRYPGQSTLGTQSANAAKRAAATARNIVNEAEPSVLQANSKLAELHDIEDTMNSNLVREGKPEAGLLAAGSGGNPRSAKSLQRLGEATGSDMLSDAEKLAAMRTFGSPKLMAVDTTGKAAGRMGLAAGLGYLAGHAPGAVAATALTSPAALRTAIDTGRLTKAMLQNPRIRAAMGEQAVSMAQRIFDSGAGQTSTGLIKKGE